MFLLKQNLKFEMMAIKEEHPNAKFFEKSNVVMTNIYHSSNLANLYRQIIIVMFFLYKNITRIYQCLFDLHIFIISLIIV